MSKDYGFEDELDSLEDFSSSIRKREDENRPSKKAVKAIAEATGWNSREPESKSILSIRAEKTLIREFKEMALAQEPKWPQEYLLRRALQALKRELS